MITNLRQRQRDMTKHDKEKMESTDSTLFPELLWLLNQLRDKGASSWLSAMPLADQGLALNKQEYIDALHLRYNLPLIYLPSLCECVDKFTVGPPSLVKRGAL